MKIEGLKKWIICYLWYDTLDTCCSEERRTGPSRVGYATANVNSEDEFVPVFKHDAVKACELMQLQLHT
jgi:hypothetical protein